VQPIGSGCEQQLQTITAFPTVALPFLSRDGWKRRRRRRREEDSKQSDE
jgi:hypothetical protein